MDLAHLPGGDLVAQGLRDVERGIDSEAALLVRIGGPRLRRLGFQIPPEADLQDGDSSPEHRLYAKLARREADSAHSRYNALIRRLVSFERSAECAR